MTANGKPMRALRVLAEAQGSLYETDVWIHARRGNDTTTWHGASPRCVGEASPSAADRAVGTGTRSRTPVFRRCVMTDTSFEGFCPVCGAVIITDEPFVACDDLGRSTGDYAEDIFDGTSQAHVGHPGCVVKVAPHPETL